MTSNKKEKSASEEPLMIPNFYGEGEHPFMTCGFGMSPEKRKEMEKMFPIPESQEKA